MNKSKYDPFTTKYLTLDEVEQLAQRIWYAPRDKAVRTSDGKHAAIINFGYGSRNTEFPFRNQEWTEVGKYQVRVQYAMWDIPTTLFVRKAQLVC